MEKEDHEEVTPTGEDAKRLLEEMEKLLRKARDIVKKYEREPAGQPADTARDDEK